MGKLKKGNIRMRKGEIIYSYLYSFMIKTTFTTFMASGVTLLIIFFYIYNYWLGKFLYNHI